MKKASVTENIAQQNNVNTQDEQL